MPRDSGLDSFCKGVLAELATFQIAAKCGNRIDAAAVCGISPQAVGKILTRLERRLSGFTYARTPIFDPSPKIDLVLTPYGDLLLHFANEVLERSEKFLADARPLSRHDVTLRIATTHGISGYFARFIQANIPRRTNAPVLFQTFSGLHYPEKIYEEVRSGTADLGITSYPPAVSPPFVLRYLRPQPLAMVFNAAYRNIPNGPVRIAELVRQDNKLKIAIHRKTYAHPLAIQIVNYVRRHGANLGPSQFVEADNTEQIKELILDSQNVVGILPEIFMRTESLDLKVIRCPLDPPLPLWKWAAIYRSHSSNRALGVLLVIIAPFFIDRGHPKKKSAPRARS